MAKELTAEEIKAGYGWFKTTFYPIAKDEAYKARLWSMTGLEFKNSRQYVISAVKKLYKLIENQVFDPQRESDEWLETVASQVYSNKEFGKENGGRQIDFDEETIAAILVRIACKELGFVWSVEGETAYTVKSFLKTKLGKAILAEDGFNFPAKDVVAWADKGIDIKAVKDAKQAKYTNDDEDDAPADLNIGSSTRALANGPTATWQGHGGLAARIPGLLGDPTNGRKPEEKIIPNKADVFYTIKGKKSEKSKKYFYPLIKVKPKDISKNRNNFDSATQSYHVWIKDNSNVGDCNLFFTKHSIAQSVCDKLTASYAARSEPVDYELKVVTVDQYSRDRAQLNEGYLCIQTNYGPVYIIADKINEELAINANSELINENTNLDEEKQQAATERINELLNEFLDWLD